MSSGTFFKRHILRLAGLFLLWSPLYAVGSRVASGSFGSAYDFFYSVMAGHYHMWFISAMVTCCLFIPILHAAIHGAKKLDTRWLSVCSCSLCSSCRTATSRLTLRIFSTASR